MGRKLASTEARPTKTAAAMRLPQATGHAVPGMPGPATLQRLQRNLATGRPGWSQLSANVLQAADGRQAAFSATVTAARQAVAPNRTGLPAPLKSGVEALSGMALDNVRVHYNSSLPAQLNAHAYGQGTSIHLAPGQERHLPHEAWHVVQQAQGRVQPIGQRKGQIPINNDAGLEREADIMGSRALQMAPAPDRNGSAFTIPASSAGAPVQRVISGHPRYVLHTPAALSPAASQRVHAAAATLAAVINADATVRINQIILSIEAEHGLNYSGGASTIAGDNPAETTLLPHPPGDPDIEITLQRPFAETATVGELLGMLAHEVGVHSLPSARNIGDENQNAWLPAVTPVGTFNFNAWPIPPTGPPLASKDADERQHDHVVTGQIVNAPLVHGVAPATRGQQYFKTVLDIGDRIWANAALSLQDKTAQTTELVHLFLVDVGRIVATDDGRLPVTSNKQAVSDMYGHVFTTVVLPHRPHHPWIPAARPKANVWRLGLSLAAFVAKVKANKAIWG